MGKPSAIIISPASASANNGNWQTASRWLRFLRRHYRVKLAANWDGEPADILIALHARRSADSIEAFAGACPSSPLIVVLTGTDLYRDIMIDNAAQRSLASATRLVVLQERGMEALPVRHRPKAVVIHQSAALRSPSRKRVASACYVTMVGHLRDVKNPACFMRAAAAVSAPNLRFIQIGDALDADLGAQARTTHHACAHYRWLGNLSHARTLRYIRRSRLLVLPSRMEGGANVIIEAIRSGVPVLASDIPGNRGMLGDDYAGYFAVDDSTALADLISRCVDEPKFYARLSRLCKRRAALFSPVREQTALLQLLDNVRHSLQEPS